MFQWEIRSADGTVYRRLMSGLTLQETAWARESLSRQGSEIIREFYGPWR